MIKFVIANISDFEQVGIDVSTCRKSIDGLKALKHIENLSAEELNTIRFMQEFEFVGESIHELMQTEEWREEENIPTAVTPDGEEPKEEITDIGELL